MSNQCLCPWSKCLQKALDSSLFIVAQLGSWIDHLACLTWCWVRLIIITSGSPKFKYKIYTQMRYQKLCLPNYVCQIDIGGFGGHKIFRGHFADTPGSFRGHLADMYFADSHFADNSRSPIREPYFQDWVWDLNNMLDFLFIMIELWSMAHGSRVPVWSVHDVL